MRKFLVASAIFALAHSATAQIQVIHSEVPGHPTALIPGALDAAGDPADLEFKALEGLSMSPDGTHWILRGRANSDANIDTFLLLGMGTTSTMLAQENRPVLGGQPNEVYDFFDAVAGFNENNEYAFGARARGGVASVFEKVIRVTDTQTGIVAQMGDLLTGAMDLPPNPSGDERLGNSLNGIHLLNDDSVGFVDLSTTGIHTSRRPLLVRSDGATHNVFLQSGVSPVDGNVWDTFSTDGFITTPDGAHYMAIGDDEGATTNDRILVYDGNVVMRENTILPGTSITAVDAFHFRMLPDGTWLARGDDTADNDWALRNGVLLAQTGDPITTGTAETWGNTFSGIAANNNGDWVLVGNTSESDTARDNVIVLNGTDVVVRENDPVDLNGNGMADDDAFIGRGNNTLAPFTADDVYLTDEGILWFVASLRDSMGNDLGSIPAFGAGGQALLRLDLKLGTPCGPCGDSNCDGTVSVSDIAFFVEAVVGGQAAWEGLFKGGAPCDFLCANDTSGDGGVTVGDIGVFVGLLTGAGSCP